MWWPIYSRKIAASHPADGPRRREAQFAGLPTGLVERPGALAAELDGGRLQPMGVLNNDTFAAGRGFDYGPFAFWNLGSRLHRRLFSTETASYALRPQPLKICIRNLRGAGSPGDGCCPP